MAARAIYIPAPLRGSTRARQIDGCAFSQVVASRLNLGRLTPDGLNVTLVLTRIAVLADPGNSEANLMEPAIATQVVDTFLHTRLEATGVSGFEGLVAVLVQEATGQEFRLSSAGRQSGRDAGSEVGFANSIKVETFDVVESLILFNFARL